MGLGSSKIDYKERDFTKQPLEEEEIDILLDALPEDSIIDSIESEGREKILRAMSDQKLFNIRGDSIFDYYFTNNKEDIKGCMTNQFTRDGTPCPDGKFNRMITRIPDLVQGPLREKEIEWDIERTSLESKYNTLNTSKTNLQSQFDTLNEERKQNLDTLALDSFLGNPEMYNKMLKEKISQKTLAIFTKDGDINIDVKETLEFKHFSQYFETAYESKKSVLPPIVESFKKGKPSSLEQFKNKDFVNQLIGTGNLMIIYFFYVYLIMKIVLQYNSTDKKRVPNETVYNSFSEFFNELGIEKQQFEYVLKFIAFNTFKKFMDYESNNNAKGLDIFLKDSLKIVEKFIGKEYVNYLSNFDYNTDMIFDYVHTTSGEPNMSVSEEMCKLYMETKGYGFKSVNEKMAQSGCIFSPSNDAGNKGFYNKATTNNKCTDGVPCVQKALTKEDFKTVSSGKPFSKYKDVSSGTPSKNMTEDECKAFGKTIKGRVWISTGSWDNDPTGCITDGKKTWFNKDENSHDCGYRGYDCVEKNTKNVSEQQCKAYAKLLGKELRTDITDRLSGCSIGYGTPNSREKIGMVYYGPQGNDSACGTKFSESSYISDCIQLK